MKSICDGSRRPVRGERHQLKTLASGHMQACCPVCKRRLFVTRVMGVLEFPRHEPPTRQVPSTAAKTKTKRYRSAA